MYDPTKDPIYQAKQKEQQSLQDRLNAIKDYDKALRITDLGTQPLDFTGVNPAVRPSTVYGITNNMAQETAGTIGDMRSESNALLDFMARLRSDGMNNAISQRKLELEEAQAMTPDRETLQKELEFRKKNGYDTKELEAQLGLKESEQQSEEARLILDVVNQLLSRKTSGVTGKLRTHDLSSGYDQQTQGYLDQLKGILTLDNVSKMKGTGALSDKEFAVLTQAATSLTEKADDGSFRKELEKIKQGLASENEDQDPLGLGV